MERLMNNVNIIRRSPLSLKDSRNRTHTASLELKLGGQKTRADIWTKWQLKIGLKLSLGANDKDIRTTGSWLSTLRHLSDRLLGCSEKRSRTCDSKMNNQAILRSCRGTKLDGGHPKNVIKNNSGSGTRGQNSSSSSSAWSDRNPGGPPQSGRITVGFDFFSKGPRLLCGSFVEQSPLTFVEWRQRYEHNWKWL